VPLTVNHKDGDSENHRPDNLELLCPGCHSLTPNFGKLNLGRGRRQRRERLQLKSLGM
jgi:5-methylcytosine-specific restriction endonuclease McrA